MGLTEDQKIWPLTRQVCLKRSLENKVAAQRLDKGSDRQCSIPEGNNPSKDNSKDSKVLNPDSHSCPASLSFSPMQLARCAMSSVRKAHCVRGDLRETREAIIIKGQGTG